MHRNNKAVDNFQAKALKMSILKTKQAIGSLSPSPAFLHFFFLFPPYLCLYLVLGTEPMDTLPLNYIPSSFCFLF